MTFPELAEELAPLGFVRSEAFGGLVLKKGERWTRVFPDFAGRAVIRRGLTELFFGSLEEAAQWLKTATP